MNMNLEQAKQLRYGDRFHEDECVLNVRPSGGVNYVITEWRVNGKIRTWKRDTSRIAIPSKHGFRECFTFSETYLDKIHLPADCPLAGLKLYGKADVEV